MKKYQVVAVTPQGSFRGKIFAEENLEEARRFFKEINTYSYITLEDAHGDYYYLSEDMIGRTVFTIQQVYDN